MKRKPLFSALVILSGFFGSVHPASAQKVPAPVDGERIIMELSEADVECTIKIEAEDGYANDIWADLNGNGKYDSGERLDSGEFRDVEFRQTKAIVYGKMAKFLFRGSSAGDYGATFIDISNCTGLTAFDCFANLLTELDLSKANGLTFVNCGKNQLTKLDLPANADIETLNCSKNKITSLNLSANTKLTTLSFFNNELTNIDLSGNTALEWLFCNGNKLTKLDVSANANLIALQCSNNQLTALDLSKTPKLTTLNCYSNRIKDTAMRALIESLPTITEGEGRFVPYNDDEEGGEEENVCTTEHVEMAKAKNWKVLTSWGEPFPGITALISIEGESEYSVYAQDGILYLSGMEQGLPVQVYTVGGSMMYSSVASGSAMEIQLPRGAAYVVRIGSHAIKTAMP
ncbi:leucine-rich repeat domain-containing protein [Porphyromonas gingivalis]|uniref:leucine-rich repeat domain-containing protein n=1 Tax=Porphyromonas gingivalis TaxID=837 RepID=UPI0024DFE3EE|nr:leucine-rich repeat domain-containing protein [Porphyromonas gingivalis]WIM91022.1 leucine-rich repeat domain-containing protein [Porphyromonas gingivalis]